ncbi:unnamed protein product [Discula destructiva]
MAHINETLAFAEGSNASRSSMALVLFSTVVIGLYALYLYLLPKPLPGIPYDKAASRSILGSMSSMQSFRETHDMQHMPWFSHEASRLNSSVCQFWFGPFQKPSVILNDAREAQDILMRRSGEFGRGKQTVDLFKNVTPEFHVALLSEDFRYKRNKLLVRDLMSPSFLESISAPEIYRRGIYMIEYWQTKMQHADGRPFQAKKDIFNVLADMVTAAGFTLAPEDSIIRKLHEHLEQLPSAGVSMEPDGTAKFPRGYENPYYDALDRLGVHQGDQTRTPLPAVDHAFRMATDATLRSAYQVVHKYETEQIDSSLKRFQDGRPELSALDHVLRKEAQIAEKEGRKPEYYARRIYDEMSGFYAAGHETSASTLSWAVKHLVLSQDVQSSLRVALRQALPEPLLSKRQPKVLEIVKTAIPYLDAVIEETLRLHPSLPLQQRETKTDTIILGYRVPKGTRVWMVPNGPSYTAPARTVSEDLRSETSKSKDLPSWEKNDADLDCYRPARWLIPDEAHAGGVRFDKAAAPMQAFGHGPRACFGRKMAYMQLRVMITLMIWNFEFLPVEERLSSFIMHETTVAGPRECYIRLKEAPAA